MLNETISFIGAGNMAHSLIGGLIADGYDAQKIWATNLEVEKLTQLHIQFHIHTSEKNTEGAENAAIIVFCVKPQLLKTVATELAPIIQKNKPLVISIAAGVRATDLQVWLGGDISIVRCMPNTPALIRCGATALYANSFVSESQKNTAESILRAVGVTVWLSDETKLDAVTALSGSGPAYFFRFIEALEKTGIELGLPPETARLLTLQTALGAARMALESSSDVSTLRQQVTSPGGTTERALSILESGGFATLINEALKGAQKRSVELGELLGK